MVYEGLPSVEVTLRSQLTTGDGDGDGDEWAVVSNVSFIFNFNSISIIHNLHPHSAVTQLQTIQTTGKISH